ncbi:MAG: BadF/BadG/BcrA/BcrD ATPase family protein [Firmicutes bacterium]|nr:BadF/BadG/BcrA/BcrD ATPase family protein [Bacillota bacterium]MDD4263319.1 BadF/BadG/BcrA/BcrD ATPase family protein [Bacillota bacterium]MDD4693780.1 BadF/BadG/BcrA/BcrD ATPase family protein [Bacillota bacterium]
MGYVLAVDGGQSTTLSVIAKTDGTILGAGLGGPANHLHEEGAKERCKKSIRDSLLGAMLEADLKSVSFDHVVLGMTGATDLMKSLIWEVLRDYTTLEHFQFEHDSVTAWAGGTGGEPGVVVIGGTGSVALAVDSKGNRARVGGWGYYMGDEGSAYQIALMALSAATKGYEGRGPKTTLSQAFVDHFGVDDLWGVHAKVYSSEMDRADLAKLSKIVGDGANKGDQVCLNIMSKAAHELALLVIAAAAKVDFTDVEPIVSTAGGVWKAGLPIWKPFELEVLGSVDNAKVTKPIYPPSIGALVLALKGASVSMEKQVFDNIEKTRAIIESKK